MKAYNFVGLTSPEQVKFITEKEFSLTDLRKYVCEHFQINVDQFFSRDRSLSYAREMFLYLVFEKIRDKDINYMSSLPSLLSTYTRRDRTNCLHFKRMFENENHLYDTRIFNGVKFKDHYKKLLNNIKSLSL